MLLKSTKQTLSVKFRILFQRGVFKNIKPINFATFATPHIGLLRTSSTWSALLATLGPKLLSRTGEQFYTVDQWGASGRSLLETMADKSKPPHFCL